MNANVTTLDNGLRVVTVPMPHVQSAAVGILVGVGGRHESAVQAGISHFIEHLLFKGTATLSARAISRAIEGRGAFCDAFTQEEETCYFIKTPADRLGAVFRIMAEMYTRPRFAPRDIERERRVIVDEIMMYRDQPDQIAEETVSSQLFPRHALGRPLAGTPDSIGGLQRDAVVGFKDACYVPANTVFAFSGRIEPDQCIEKAQRWTAAMPCGTVPHAPRFGGRSRPRPRVQCLDKPAEQTHLALGFRAFGRHDNRRHALQVLNIILGESMNSRLFQSIRERRGLVYAISSGTQLFDETGELMISAGADPARIGTVLRLVVRELRRLREQPVKGAELRQACDYAAGQIVLNLEGTSGRMMWAGGSVLHLGRVVAPETVIQRLRSVNACDVQATAAALFRKNKAAVSLVGPGASRKYTEIEHVLEELS